MPSDLALKDKTIFITGGSLGIGYAVAEHCVAAGARIALAARTEKDLKEAAARLKGKGPHDPISHALDVGDPQAVRKAAEWTRKLWGNLDGLVNCAGVYGPIGRIDEISLEEFEKATRINFLGTVSMCHYFVPLLKERKGRIVNFSGGGAAAPFARYSAYACSKAAVVRLTENLAEELAELGIAANAVAPGFVVTRLHDQTLKAGDRAGKNFLEGTKKQIEKGGVPAEKAARLTVFLLSEAAAGINGKFISAPWDDWQSPDFVKRLKEEKNFTALRRIDSKSFAEVPSR